MARDTTRITFVPTVKAYPTPSERYGEAVCVAGVRTDSTTPEWVRLYPVLFRDLPAEQQFSKYDVLELDVQPSSDYRPESRRPIESTIVTVGHLDTADRWRERRKIIEPLLVESMCDVRRRQEDDGTSLAAFRPAHVDDVVPEPEEGDWTPEQRGSLSRISLFAQDRTLLKKVPWRFRYHYSCGVGGCNGHAQTIIDWEIHAAYLKWRRDHSEDETVRLVREKWLNELCGPTKDTIFFVGNQRDAPRGFLVLGVFWPPAERPSQQMEHLDLGV